tara:strand:+ start:1018 stop:1299 length:282 start_codon:yes stop_codon:yes gene_type:complete
MKKVYSISINGKNDCVILDEEEAALIKLKYMPNIRMYDMTKLHGYEPESYKKAEREEQLSRLDYARELALEGVKWNGNVKTHWTPEDLLSGNI